MPSEDFLRIYVNKIPTIEGDKLTAFNLEPDATCEDLKDKIFEKFKIKKKFYYLMSNGRVLENGSLVSNGVQQNDFLELRYKKPPIN